MIDGTQEVAPHPAAPVHPQQRSESGGQPLIAALALRSASARNPNKIAIRELDRFGQPGREVTYGALVERIDRLGQATIGALALKRDDNAAVLGPNCLEVLEVTVGVSSAGVRVATLSPRLNASEIAEIVEDCGAKILFVHPSALTLAQKISSKVRVVRFGEEYETLLASAAPGPLPANAMAAETDGFLIPYTSGTTGRAKGVVITHRSRNICCYAMGVEFGCFGPDDRFLALAPIVHGGGYVMALAPLFFGGTADLMDGFDPETTLRVLHSGVYTGVFFVPTHFHGMFALPAETLARYKGHGLKTIISNAAPLPQETKYKIVEYFGEGLLNECYGSTEAGIVTNLRPPDQLRKMQCVGLPFPGTMVRIVDDNGNEVGPNEVGELLSRSPMNFLGYWERPDENLTAMRDGWISAGDLAKRDDEGYIYIVDRKKDMIISGGINVYPREIEETLMQLPGISEIAVVGLPDDYWGERLVAFVVASEDRFPDEQMSDYCAQNLSSYKRPREFRWVDALPRNANGKILKRVLRDTA
jgi:long-chain acyl-CoA synthetase